MHTPILDFWFEFASHYSYLSVMRIEDLARQHGVRVRWNPFLLGPIFRSLGFATSPFVEQKEKGDYAWRDLQRQAEKFALPWRQPSRFPRGSVLPARIALVGAGQVWGPEFCRRAMALNFVEDTEIDDADAMAGVLESLGQPAAQVIALAQSEPVKLRLRAQTEAARALGIFGAPTFFARGEMFWGNDRLEDALAHCIGLAPGSSRLVPAALRCD
ncbi:2-hydroxychromene-2-carboxylate isomerase [Ramlibacter sp. AN1015]|uniref:2-hydroxychromene-2-carboxylate isomerase n=1 Tax=Ramlibacter sp. AN1015 TaxID=3133428 RepID=UPI0030BA9F14